MDDFESNVRKFYSVGGKSFLTKCGSTGDDETFYMHVLRYYIIMIARKIFRKHTLGVGIYTMQGYERRNKESKNTLRRFNNNKGNIVATNLKRLWDIFHYEHTAV